MFCSRIAGRKSRFTLAKNYEPRIWKGWAVIVVAACAAIDGQSSPRQTSDPAVAAPGSGFVSDTAQVNGTTLHYVRGGVGPAIILLHGFPEDWYAYHRIMPPHVLHAAHGWCSVGRKFDRRLKPCLV